MENVNIIGGSFLGLLCGIKLLKSNYKVNIYEKRSYLGGGLNSFDGLELTNSQLFNNFVVHKNEMELLDELVSLNLEKINIYKSLNFRCKTTIDIKVGYENLERVFIKFTKTNNDKKIIKIIFEDISEISRIENILENKNKCLFFSFNKYIYEKRLNVIISKYKKIRVEDIIDTIDSVYIKEMIKSIANAKTAGIVFIDMLKIMCFYDIYKFDGGVHEVFNKLETKFLELGGEIKLNTNISEIEIIDDKQLLRVKANEDFDLSKYVICTANNLYSLKSIVKDSVFDREFQRVLKDSELFDSYLIINIYLDKDINFNNRINRYILEKPFIDNTGAFHRKYEVIWDKSKSILTAYIRGNYYFWEQLYENNNNQIRLNKFVLGEKLLEELKISIPELNKTKPIKIDVITPYDFMKENDCIRGSSRGILTTPKLYNRLIKINNDMSNCYFSRQEFKYGNYINSKLKESIRIVDKILLK
ncbi:NAD(P)-binding protein [uncultured Clostridium sp.]|uniref:NAD(P)-binding protein n=1 Tax=uncultured Clostridium sp. TaxID=59620 RepID=UPI002638E97B|nr:NAD(P)-binding protein [uncultured Clostridium sp.]